MTLPRLTVANGLWLAAYLAMTVVVVWSMVKVRRHTLAELDTPQAQADWKAWRTAVEEQAAGKGPVARRVPKSQRPPLLVLMQDHFTVCLSGALFFSSLLFVVFMLLARGVLVGPRVRNMRDTPLH